MNSLKSEAASKFGFLVGFIIAFAAINYLPLSFIFKALDIGYVISWSLSISLVYILCHMLGSTYKHKAAAIIYSIATTWLGTIFLAWTVSVVVWLLAIIVPMSITVQALVITLGSVMLALISFYLGHSFVITDHTIHLKGLDERIKMVHLSDLHLHGIEARKDLAHVLHKVAILRPDIITISGDLLDVPGLVDNTILQQFNQFSVPIVFVSGNHDRYLGMDNVARALAHTKIRILRNESWTWKKINFVGLDDSDNANTLLHKLPAVPANAKHPYVLLYHKPTSPEVVAARGYSLMLCGHTHNGQIFPFTLLVRLAYKYIRGLHRIDRMILYINQGTGTWGIPMRLGSRNEIAVFHLVPSEHAKA